MYMMYVKKTFCQMSRKR